MKVSKSDAVTYTALVATAIIQAFDTFRKEAAIPLDTHSILANPVWSYIPIALLTLVGLIWLGRQFGWWDKPSDVALSDKTKQIRGQTFKHETVPLDGIEYVNCTFVGVTFEYQGTGVTRLTNCILRFDAHSDVKVLSSNPVVKQTLYLARLFGQLPANKPQLIERPKQ
jgi:hypothetical protein